MKDEIKDNEISAALLNKKEGNKKSLRLSDAELDSLILLIPREIRTKTKSGILEYPSFSTPIQFPSDSAFKTDSNKILFIADTPRDMPWKNLNIKKKKNLLSNNLDMLDKFIEISFIDRKLRVEKAEQINKINRAEKEKEKEKEEKAKIDENNFSSDCDDQIVKMVKKFVSKYGPLWFCSDHGFCFLKKPSRSSDDLCNWNFKETVLNYVNFSRIFHALARCNPTSYTSFEDNRKKEIANSQRVAQKLFDSIRQSSDYSFVSDWGLVRSLCSLCMYDREFNTTNVFDVYQRTLDFSEAMSDLMNIHPFPVRFRSNLKPEEDKVYEIDDPTILEAIEKPEIFYDLGIGVYRVLMLQFIRAFLNPGRLVICSNCDKPYLRDRNISLKGGNRCRECRGEKRTESP